MSRINIFRMPELVGLIHAWMKTTDRLSLAQTNHGLFEMVMPTLWESVEGLRQLLALIPNLDRILKLGTQPVEVFNQVLDRADLTRFDLYAQWVKHLELCKRGQPKFKSLELYLLRYFSSKRVLVPNLLSLTCTDFHAHEDVQLVLPFLASSLVSLKCIFTPSRCNSYMTTNEASLTLYLVSQKCPNLRTLAIYPHNGGDNDLCAYRFLSHSDQESVIPRLGNLGSFLGGVRSLVSFSCSAQIVNEDCLRTMSSWRSLESLEIVFDSWMSHEPPRLTDIAFPALKHLSLCQVNPCAIGIFWGLSQFVRNLRSVKIFIMTFHSGDLSFDDILRPALIKIAAGSPKLGKIWIQESYHTAGLSPLNISTLQPLQKLSLLSIRLESIVLRGPDDTKLSGLSAALALCDMFPNLRELAVPNTPISVFDLPDVRSRIPQLHLLSLDLAGLPTSDYLISDISQLPRNRPGSLRVVEVDIFGVIQQYFGSGTRQTLTYSYAHKIIR
ncbi:F-box protein [Ceratobasidium sp. AG-Ba]|nr:F-box protein [Ceratobasidium sp. AG-Ba]